MLSQPPAPDAMMPATTVRKYVRMTSGTAIITARGISRCGFSTSPASVDIDS